MKPEGSEEQPIFKSRWNGTDLKNKIYIQIKQNPNGSKEQALSSNQDETGRIYLQIKMKRDGSNPKSI